MHRHLITLASVALLVVAAAAPPGAFAASPSAATTSPAVAPSPVVASPVDASQVPVSPGALVPWQAAPPQAALADIQPELVVWTGSRFIAAGLGSTAGYAFLDSSDGSTWHLQPSLGKGAKIDGLAAGPSGVLAVGSRGDHAASWWSADGLTWTSAPLTPSLRGTAHDAVSMRGATATDAGWLAVGEEDAPCQVDCDGSARRGLTWTSTDGLHWDRAAHQPSLLRGVDEGGRARRSRLRGRWPSRRASGLRGDLDVSGGRLDICRWPVVDGTPGPAGLPPTRRHRPDVRGRDDGRRDGWQRHHGGWDGGDAGWPRLRARVVVARRHDVDRQHG